MDGLTPTLPDYLAPGLRLVVIGLNPSPASIAAGYYYGNPRNRFWPALRAAGLVPADFEPSPGALSGLRDNSGIGFTDIVKRPTPGGADLRAADYRRDAPRLAERLDEYRPRVAWFNGKGVYQNYRRYALGERPGTTDFGRQADLVDGVVAAIVTPNPSPANAAFSLEQLTAWYRDVGALAGLR